jgi:nucleoside-diphosphate-sugar epimerase
MKVLVTGATGFIGRYLIKDLLKNNHKVRVLTRQTNYKNKKVSVFPGDVTKKETLSKAFEGVDAVFHNAAYAMDWGSKIEIYKHNVEGTRNVADICKEKKVKKLIFTSSAGVYGFPNSLDLIDENFEKNPLNYYQKSKLESEKLLKKYDSIKISIVRPTMVFGAGGHATKLLINRIQQGEMMYIGIGDTYLSIVHPADVAQCLRLALEKDKKGDVFNAVSIFCTVKELIKEITSQLGINPQIKHVSYQAAYATAIYSEMSTKKEPALTRFRVKTFGTNRKISNEKSQKILGFKPQYNLKSIVEDMVSDYK